MPGSNTNMRGVQSLLSSYHQKDITILDGISEKLVVTNLPFRDIAIALAVDALLQSTDTRLPLRMSQKHLVTGRMGGHPIYVDGLDFSEGRIILNILHDAFLYIVIHPEGEIVLAFYIRYLSADIAHVLQMITESCKTGFLMLGTHRQGSHDFHVGSTIQLPGIHHEQLFLCSVQGATHIRNTHKLLSKPHHPVGRLFLHRLRLLQQGYDSQTILALINHARLGKSRHYHQECRCKN